MISNAKRVLKIYNFPALEMLKVKTTLGTLCRAFSDFNPEQYIFKLEDEVLFISDLC